MIIQRGLFHNKIIKNNLKNKNKCYFSGTCFNDGIVKISIISGQNVILQYTIGNAQNGTFTGCINNIPIGGPYIFRLWIENIDNQNCENIEIWNIYVVPYTYDYQNKNLNNKPIKLNYVKYYLNKKDYNHTDILIKYKNVNGKIKKRNNNNDIGFKITLDQYDVHISEIEFAEDSIILHTNILYYGLNNFSKCYINYSLQHNSLFDESGTLLPEMNYISLEKNRLISPYIQIYNISKICIYKDEFSNLTYPKNENLEFNRNIIKSNICSLNIYYKNEYLINKIIYFKFNILCHSNIKLKLHLGHSGPIKVWMNRIELLCKTNKNTLISPNDSVIECNSIKGINEILIALKVISHKNKPDCEDAIRELIEAGIMLKIEYLFDNKSTKFNELPMLIR